MNDKYIEALNLKLNTEVERRVSEWIAAAEGFDFSKLLSDTLKSNVELISRIRRLEGRCERLRAALGGVYFCSATSISPEQQSKSFPGGVYIWKHAEIADQALAQDDKDIQNG